MTKFIFATTKKVNSLASGPKEDNISWTKKLNFGLKMAKKERKMQQKKLTAWLQGQKKMA